MMPWWGWLILGVLVLLNVIGWFGGDEDDDDEDETAAEVKRLADQVYDLRGEVYELRKDCIEFEKVGVIEGLFDLEECGYWRPTTAELEMLADEYPNVHAFRDAVQRREERARG